LSGTATDSVEVTVEAVLDLCRNSLGIHIDNRDISNAHRLPKRAGSREKHCPIIVRFSSRRVRNTVYAAKKALKDTGIYISEHLTREAGGLFFETRQLLKSRKIYATWTRDGIVYIRKTDPNIDPTGRPSIVKSSDDLAKQLIRTGR
jgi:hypothetical protein